MVMGIYKVVYWKGTSNFWPYMVEPHVIGYSQYANNSNHVEKAQGSGKPEKKRKRNCTRCLFCLLLPHNNHIIMQYIGLVLYMLYMWCIFCRICRFSLILAQLVHSRCYYERVISWKQIVRSITGVPVLLNYQQLNFEVTIIFKMIPAASIGISTCLHSRSSLKHCLSVKEAY